MAGRVQTIQLKIDDGGTLAAAIRAARGMQPKIMSALTRGAKDGADLLMNRITEATATWGHPPRMATRPASSSLGPFGKTTASYQVVMDGPSKDNPYPWVDLGTRGPYIIEAKNAPFLVFATGFVPKTDPSSLTAGPGGASGPTVHRRAVLHPGIEARNITDRVVEMTRTRAEDDMQSLVLDAIEKAWEG